jgi:3-methyladenine DNA glycosylase AlkD
MDGVMSSKQMINDILQLGNADIAEHSKRFFKTGPGEYGEGDKFVGIRVPPLRKIAKKYKFLPLVEVSHVIQSEYHEIRLAAVMLLVYRIERADNLVLEEVVDFYLKHLEYVNNWDLVDSSCHQILGRYLTEKEKDLLFHFAHSSNIWERRIAMITCYYFIKRNSYSTALEIATLLLHDSHDLIHKAVGWMLREIGKLDLDIELEFLDKHFRDMPRTMLRYAIEKFEEPLRLKYLHG